MSAAVAFTRNRRGLARNAAVLIALTVFLSLFSSLAAPAQAAPAIKIDAILYNPPGNDTGSNTSLNAEWIRLENTTSKDRTITGWTIRDKSGHVYKFPKTTIKAKSTVALRSGEGTNGTRTRYWQKDWYVWNNSGDTAYLRNASGTQVHTCKYTSTSTGRKTCA